MTATQKWRLAAVATGLAFVLLPNRAVAQAVATGESSKGYAEAVAQSSFGSVTSQSYGAEIGYAVWNDAQVFVEAGHIKDVSTSSLSSAAQVIATALTQLQPAAVGYSAKEPVSFFAAGIRYPLVLPDVKAIPYALAGFGVAQVKKDVSFTLGGADASASLGQYVTLGEDLTGTKSSPMLTLGAGVMWPAWRQLVVDFQFRFGRIFADDAVNVGRAGIGLGVRF